MNRTLLALFVVLLAGGCSKLSHLPENEPPPAHACADDLAQRLVPCRDETIAIPVEDFLRRPFRRPSPLKLSGVLATWEPEQPVTYVTDWETCVEREVNVVLAPESEAKKKSPAGVLIVTGNRRFTCAEGCKQSACCPSKILDVLPGSRVVVTFEGKLPPMLAAHWYTKRSKDETFGIPRDSWNEPQHFGYRVVSVCLAK